MEDSYVFYYEYESAEDGKAYGGFLRAPTYTDAMKILEDYTGSDLGCIKTLKGYNDLMICISAEETQKMKAIYEAAGGI